MARMVRSKDTSSLGSYKGIADLYALKDGRHVWIEVKTDRGRQSEHQRQFEQDIRDHGGRYIVARGIEDIEKHLKGGCEIENKAEIKTCANCERSYKQSNGRRCRVFISKPEKCWAWTDDPEWDKQVKAAVERYKLIS